MSGITVTCVITSCRAGREVAVKVIDHDTEAQAAVTNEVELMLSFNHPNIVSAVCVTFVLS
jgi:hypothetical protein